MFSTPESKRGAFLEAAREAREERAAERQREEATVLIQSTVRGWLVRQRVINTLREKFDTILPKDTVFKEENLPNAISVFKVAIKIFRKYDAAKDEKRLETYVRYLLASLLSSNIKLSCIGCPMDKELILLWIQHIKKILALSCAQLEKLKAEVVADNKLIMVYLHILLSFTATSTWKILDKFPPIINAMNKLTHNIMNDLITQGLFRSLKVMLTKALCRDRPELKGTALTAAITLVIRVAVCAEYSNNILSLIIIHILSIPAFIQHLETIAVDALQMLKNQNLFTKSVNFMYSEQNLKVIFNTLEGSYSLCLLANIIHLGYHEKEGALLQLAYPKFNFIIGRLLDKCGEYVTTKQSSLTQWHPILGWFSSPLDNNLNQALPSVRTQIQLLWSTPMLKVMFTDLHKLVANYNNLIENRQTPIDVPTPSVMGSSGSNFLKRALEFGLSTAVSGNSAKRTGVRFKGTFNKLGSPEITKVAHVCSTYYAAITTLTQLRMDILTGLCYKCNIVGELWLCLLSLGSVCGLKSFTDLLAITTKISAPEFHLVMLFCDSVTHLVTVIDDLEMYEQQKPFTLAEYTTMSQFLNNFCYKLLHNSLVDLRNDCSCPLFTSVHTLLMLLYKRNSRRPYVPDSHWLISEIKPNTFMSDLEKGKTTTKMILQKIPHVLPHEGRVQLFRKYVSREKSSLVTPEPTMARFNLVTVHRSRLVEDGYRQLAGLSPSILKGTIRVRFVNEQGLDEAGIDQNGVFKEFLEQTLMRIFDPSLNLFRLTSEERLYPSSTSYLTETHLQLFEFTGRMLAKALYEGILVDCPFASFFLSQVLGEQQSALYSSIDELPSLDPELYKSLTYVKHYEGDVSDLELSFCYDEDCLGKLVSHDLRPGGKGIQVTNENKIIYVHLMAHFKMHTQIKDQTRAFVRGFRSIINPEWLSIFSVPEFQRLLSGDNVAIDLKDLRKHTMYYGGFHDNHRIIGWLWDILQNDFNEKERKLFLKFVTSCTKPPLLGFAHLEPSFSIRCVEVPDEDDTGDTVGSILRGFFAIRKRDPVNRLPTASTCFNLLKLPSYQRKSTLREKLHYAITSNTGFELS